MWETIASFFLANKAVVRQLFSHSVHIIRSHCGDTLRANFVFDTGQHCILVLKNLAQEDKFASKVGEIYNDTPIDILM